MRRTSLVLVLLLTAACAYGPVIFDEPRRPAVGPRGTTAQPQPRPRPDPVTTQAKPCREVSRLRCETTQCKGLNVDYVTYECSGKTFARCVANKGCAAG
ncbi:MAG: hypothetical protein ACLGH0_11435 [Thermoanaerobaculia bacterium]